MFKPSILVSFLFVAACSSSSSRPFADDGGLADGGGVDASPPDANGLDAAAPDAFEPDAAAPDASEPDASEPDASEMDASEPDASEMDASEPDAGSACEDTDDDEICDDIDPCIGEPLLRETFEGDSAAFDLNTLRLGGADNGANRWVINNVYAGGSGTLICSGFPFSFTVVDTAPQPEGIDGAPTSTYMHLASTAAMLNGIDNSSYTAADGFCYVDETNFAEMTNDIDTRDFENISVSFWHLVGGASTSYGELYFSTDEGENWTLMTSPRSSYSDIFSWTKASFTSAALAGHETVRLGFRFVNTVSTTGADPGFSIDDIEICAAGADAE